MLNRKIAIIGAGSVGATAAYACQLRGACDAIALYDINAKKAEAHAKDLLHGSPFTPTVDLSGGDDHRRLAPEPAFLDGTPDLAHGGSVMWSPP